MTTESYQLSSAQPLTEAYIHRTDSRLNTLFGYHSGCEQDWEKRANSLHNNSNTRASSLDVANVLRLYNKRMNATEETMSAISSLAEGSPVVIGGQQAGLWTGPLLVIHKAVSIIKAAKSASEQLGITVVPLFWIAGEDHDWDEANHTYVITSDQELRKLSVARPEGARTSVSRTLLSSDTWVRLIEELEQSLPHSEFKPQLLEQLTDMSKGSYSLSDMFAHMLSHLFGREGLVLLDADDPELRKLESPMFSRMLEHNDELESAYVSTGEAIKEFGYALQAEVTASSANIFLFHPDRGEERVLLYKRNGGYEDRKGISSWTKEELLQIAAERPQLLSNNVLTRPLMQDYLFPVLGTVLGPGEIAYWALTGEAFKVLGMEMPILVPRMSFTLVEGIVAKNMEKYDLTFADVMERFDARKEKWLKDQDSLAIAEKFGIVRANFEASYKPLVDLAASIQQGLAKLGDTNMTKILEQIDYMESKTTDAHQKQFEASIRQLERIRLALHPSGKPQERVVTMVAYWNRYGNSWLHNLLEAPYSRTGGHEIVYL
ncbi:bacillithiol biosynthesis cysteine-adding enzyme BshC [Paenibacillus sp. GSMTC-2017]|uniref:bacillithiol biosynthesis cysteine-adding enzyme BshC n=1 Tax=Paenibacillus sp. GSMTC-2017 TaxID=2794350 RepID=UPI0018D82536|nr:bacillithiol biosynthesis cysteine-adding enzyme BshC [Paenibacillus sp. GSMTC-2017]MBH5316914.1 bacillithiol biosynthesis cysteine-adding enzyme BshC [Paenibacillus sp. GSMTC-2017]